MRVTPGASTVSVCREAPDLFGETLLRVRVQAPPIDGRANEAVIEAVAQALSLRKRTVTLSGGATSRTKTLLIDSDESDMAMRLAQLPACS